MNKEQREFYYETYGIDYVKAHCDDKYEYGYYTATDNDDVVIPYQFRLSEFNK
jgi:hypothetical protein